MLGLAPFAIFAVLFLILPTGLLLFRAFETPDGVCIMGGLNRVLLPMAAHQVPPILNHFTTTFARWMQENHPNPPNTPRQPPYWNDSVFTSKEETLAWLHKFADALDPQR